MTRDPEPEPDAVEMIPMTDQVLQLLQSLPYTEGDRIVDASRRENEQCSEDK